MQDFIRRTDTDIWWVVILFVSHKKLKYSLDIKNPVFSSDTTMFTTTEIYHNGWHNYLF